MFLLTFDTVVDHESPILDDDVFQGQLPGGFPLSDANEQQSSFFASPLPAGYINFGTDTLQVDPGSQYAPHMPIHPLPAAYRHPARDILNLGQMTSLELDEMDLDQIGSYNQLFLHGVPFEMHPPPQPPNWQQVGIMTPISEDDTTIGMRQLSIRAKAFRNSQFRWTPKEERGNTETDNLSVPSGETPLSMNLEMPVWRPIGGRIDQSSRDRILSVVLTTVDHDKTAKSVLNFPSVELLDNLMNYYFFRQRDTLDIWIHSGSFRPNDSSPELLAAIVAAGAVLTHVPAIRKLGYALQEAVRIQLPKLFEQANSYTRDLQTLQAYMLQLEISLWSGNKRRIEIAEAFRQPITTMIRRAGSFRRSYYRPIQPYASDTGRELEGRWREWVQQQQLIRLVYHLFIHDIQASISYIVSPIISYAELALPLPESRQLFHAPSAVEWKNIYFSNDVSTPRIPSFNDSITVHDYPGLDTIHDYPGLNFPAGARIDLDMTELATLFAQWAPVWDFRQRQRVRRGGHAVQKAPVQLGKSRTIQKSRFSSPQCRLLLEHLGMSAHVSLEDLQAFAGKDDEEESHRVYPLVKQWIRGSECRAAICHASQLLREAKSFPKGTLVEFWAVSVYHASITLWAYGELLKRLPPGENSPQTGYDDPEELPIYLDGPNTDVLRRFVETGRGGPRISGPAEEDVDVRNPKAVMRAVCGLLKNNASDEGNKTLSMSPLVEGLTQLMEDLWKADEM